MQLIVALSAPGQDEGIEPLVIELFRLAGERYSDRLFRLLLEIAFDRPRLLAAARAVKAPIRDRAAATAPPALQARFQNELNAETLTHLLMVIMAGYTLTYPLLVGNDRLKPERLAGCLSALLRHAVPAQPPSAGA